MNTLQVKANYVKDQGEGHAYWLGGPRVRYRERGNKVYDPRTLIWELTNKRLLGEGKRLQRVCDDEACIAPAHQREVSRSAFLRNQPKERL